MIYIYNNTSVYTVLHRYMFVDVWYVNTHMFIFISIPYVRTRTCISLQLFGPSDFSVLSLSQNSESSLSQEIETRPKVNYIVIWVVGLEYYGHSSK